MKKKLFTFILTAAFATTINAQITITQNDIAGIGKVCLQAHDTIVPKTTGVINPGPAGANQTWSFSNLTVGPVDTLLFTNPNWTPAGSSFPTANLAMRNSSDSSFTYFDNSTSGLFVLGFTRNAAAMPINYIVPGEVISFPNTYNSTFSNTSKIDFTTPYTQQAGFDSVKIKQAVTRNIKSDGWGSLITPLGTFSTIRNSGQVITIDTIMAHITGNSWVTITTTHDTVKHFSWWQKVLGILYWNLTVPKPIQLKTLLG